MAFLPPTVLHPRRAPASALLSPRLPLPSTSTAGHRTSVVRAVLQADPPQEPSSKPSANKPEPGTPGHRFFEYTPDDIEAVRLRHCLVETEDLCISAHAAVSSGKTTLAELASTLSICDASRSRAGDLGWWWKHEAAPRDVSEFGVTDLLLAAALRARPHTVQRVRSERGWHVFVVEDARHVLRVSRARTPTRHNPNQKSRKVCEPIAPPAPGTYAVHTLGCQMNRSDSERMAGVLEARGLRRIDDALQASVVVLNTCNIREHAETKVYSYVGTHAVRKRLYPGDVTLVVAGCVAQQEGERMLRRVPELDVVFGPQYANRIGELLDEVERTGAQIAATEPVRISEDIAAPRRDSDVTAWINVIYGCGENCSFCTVGNVVRVVEQSRSMDAIRAEVADVAAKGFREVVLLGQNIDAYGRDMEPRVTFAQLLRHVHDVDGIERMRFTTSHPRYISENLVRTCAELPKIMPFFHIPPQSGDDAVLKAMRRGYNIATFNRVVGRIRAHMPDAAIAGDMIVGFPGETDAQFEASLQLIEEVQFDVMNTAAYSPRPRTPAAEMGGQIAEAVKSERLQRMNEVVTKVALARSKRYVGRVETVLVEEGNVRNGKKQVVGRMATNRPVYFEGEIDELKGKMVDVRIDEAFAFSVRGVMVGEAT